MWRNPYSHDGFEKGYGATIYLHPPRVRAVPLCSSLTVVSGRVRPAGADVDRVYGRALSVALPATSCGACCLSSKDLEPACDVWSRIWREV